MRDLLTDLETAFVSDADPIRRAQKQMRQPLPKRFYDAVSVDADEAGFVVRLDGRLLRTPGKAVARLPSRAAAELVAAEFAAQAVEIDPATMPVTRIVNTTIDGVAADPGAVAADIVRYSGSDLVCYRAGAPVRLVELQSQSWDPILEFARRVIRARFILAEGVIHVAQPPAALAAIRDHIDRNPDPFRIACLHVMTTLTGSALIALATEAGAISVDEAWKAAHVDEDWNIAQWGEDAEAASRRSFRFRDMAGAYALLEALRDGAISVE